MKPDPLYLAIVAALTILLLAAPAASQSPRWAYIEFPPVFFTDDAGNPTGGLIDIGAKVLDKAGFKWRAESYPTKRMIDCIVRGECGLETLREMADAWCFFDDLLGKSEMICAKTDLEIARTYVETLAPATRRCGTTWYPNTAAPWTPC